MDNYLKFGLSFVVGYIGMRLLFPHMGYAKKSVDFPETPFPGGIPFNEPGIIHIPTIPHNATIPGGGRRCNPIIDPGCEQQRSAYNP